MKNYNELLKLILDNGIESTDRTGVGTLSLIGQQLRYDLSEGFPAVTTKRLAWKSVLSELLWFIEGSHDERRLCEILHGTRDWSKRTIWTDNYENQGVSLGYSNGELGPVYGKQWRDWKDHIVLQAYDDHSEYENNGYVEIAFDTYQGIKVFERSTDQLQVLIDGLKNNPDSRRHIMNAWNVGELDKMALPPCHTLSQFFVKNGKLSCHLYQRSADLFLGVPFNIASYSLLTHMLAQVCNLEVGEFIWTGGDVHIYKNHVQAVQEQLSRDERALPTLWIDENITDIEQFTMDSFKLEGYDPHPTIKAPMAV